MMQAAKEEMRLVAIAVTGGIDKAQRREPVIDGIGIKRVEPLAIDLDGLVFFAFQAFPQAFPFAQPFANGLAVQGIGESEPLFPAVEFAHLHEIDAQGEVAGMAGIGDVAIVLDCLADPLDPDAVLGSSHGNPPWPH